jgi:voltage-gated potassium channel
MKKITSFLIQAFNDDLNSSKASRMTNFFIVLLIVISTLEVIFSSEPSFEKYSNYLHSVFVITSCVFIVEIILRIFVLYKTNPEFRGLKAFKLYFFNFYNIVDIISVLPFLIGFFGVNFSPFWKSLRVFRIFKIIRYLPSINLLVGAFKNKKNLLIISLQSILILALLLSIGLYFAEHQVKDSNFTSISKALLWSLAKFIGDIGGYGDFVPLTLTGKILATFNGILGIAIFAIPAGIIASGFVEEIEAYKKNTELNDVYNTLSKAFEFDILSGQRAKSKIGLLNARRRFISIVDAVVKLKKSESDIFEVCGLNKNLKLTKRLKPSGDEEVLIEFFENNSIYGTYINRNSAVTIVSPHSNDGFNLGHYSYCLAELLNANYLSVEKYGIYSFLEETNINFNENDFYLKDITNVNNEVVRKFIQDLFEAIKKESFVFNIGSSVSKSPSYHILTGGNKNESGIDPKGTCKNVLKAEEIYKLLEEKSKESGLTITTNTHYSTQTANHLDWFIANKLQANAMSIKVNVELMKGDNEKYYESVGILAESIKELL